MFRAVDPQLLAFQKDVGFLGDTTQAGPNLLFSATVRHRRQLDAEARSKQNAWRDENRTIAQLIGGLETKVQTAVLDVIKDFNADLVCHLLNFPKANFAKYWPLIAAELRARNIHTRPLLIGLWCNIMRESGSFLPIQGAGGVGVDAGYGPRGFIQLYGRENYRSYTRLLNAVPRFKGLDLVNNPDQALIPEVAAWITAEFALRGEMHIRAKLAYDARSDEDLWRKVRAIIFRPAYVFNNDPKLRAEINGEGHFRGFYSGVQALLDHEGQVFRAR
jgi:hypothetical protein